MEKIKFYATHKKGSEQLLSNYRPVSFLPICSKIFEKLIFDCIYDFLYKSFSPGDSCIHQLMAITHNIFTAFDANPSLEVPGIFLDLFKVFDRAWHEGFIHKINNNGIDGNILAT